MEKRKDNQIIEPETYNFLKKLIEKAETADEVLKIAKLGTTYKRTGFHFSPQLEKTTDTISYFKKNTDLSFSQDKDGITHKLIIGDNYKALLNLLIQYKGKIDIIYIDPPYGKDSMGEFAKTNYNNNITRDHLLSMLYPRLLLARQLLSETGVIFCSIDDKNQAYVKCLFDDIFEEKNFVACAPRKTGAGDAATNSDYELRKPYDFVLIYFKNKFSSKFTKIYMGEKTYPYSDNYGRYTLKNFQATGSDATERARPNLYYPIYLSKEGELSLEKSEKCTVILPDKVNGENGRWMWKKEKFISDKDKLVYQDNVLKRKVYYDDSEEQSIYQAEKAYFDQYFDETSYGNSTGTKSLKQVFSDTGKSPFKNPKPVELIKKFISLHPDKSAIVLDFFAGSGTTGQAVMELNEEDGGNRQYICVQLNEITDTTPNGIVYDVTSKRIKRVMTGKCYDGSSDFEWIKKHEALGGNLDVYNIAEVANFETTEGKTPFDVIDETLYGKEKFSSIQEKIEWVCSNFEHTQKRLEEK